jgi:hypothetical protein
MRSHQIGDLVHIPQSVDLIDCVGIDPQLTIPLRVYQTPRPQIGVITDISGEGYLRVFCDGTQWTVKDRSVYKLG